MAWRTRVLSPLASDHGVLGQYAAFEAAIAAAIEFCRPVNLTFSIVT
jgi:hypothetical protein